MYGEPMNFPGKREGIVHDMASFTQPSDQQSEALYEKISSTGDLARAALFPEERHEPITIPAEVRAELEASGILDTPDSFSPLPESVRDNTTTADIKDGLL